MSGALIVLDWGTTHVRAALLNDDGTVLEEREGVSGIDGVKAIKAVLPPEMAVYAVGGVANDTIATWLKAGTDGFGIGSNIYKAGATPDEVGEKARAFVAAYEEAVAGL